MGYSAGQGIAIGAIFGPLPILFVGLRFWARRIVGAHYGIDDWLVLPATFLCLTMGISLIVGGRIAGLGVHQTAGVDRHGQPIMTETLDNYQKIKFAIMLQSIIQLTFSKLSILFFYRRIFSPRTFRRATDACIAIVLCWCVALEITIAVTALPIGRIMDLIAFYDSIPITDALTDVMILVLPLPMIWKLQMPVKQKLAVGGMFLLGMFVIVATITRLIVIIRTGTIRQLADITYYSAPIFYWTVIESCVGVISTCLPALKPIFWRPSQSVSGAKPSYGSSTGSSGQDRSKHSARSFQPSYRLADEEGSLELSEPRGPPDSTTVVPMQYNREYKQTTISGH